MKRFTNKQCCFCSRHTNSEGCESDKFKAGASELLDIWPLFQQLVLDFCIDRIPEIALQTQSFFAMGAVLEALTSNPGPDDAPRLDRLIRESFEKHKQAWPTNSILPKWHMALHIPEQLRVHKRLLGTFVHERKHKVFKVHGTTCAKTVSWERSVSQSLLNHTINQLNSRPDIFATGDFLLHPRPVDGQLIGLQGQILVSRDASSAMQRYTHGDHVLYEQDSR